MVMQTVVCCVVAHFDCTALTLIQRRFGIMGNKSSTHSPTECRILSLYVT